MPAPTDPNVWPFCNVGRTWRTGSWYCCSSRRDDEPYQILFRDKNGGDCVLINPQSLLRMGVEKAEAACLVICFESKSGSSQSYDAWVKKVMAIWGNSKRMLTAGTKKAIDYLRIHLLALIQKDLEFLVSRWS